MQGESAGPARDHQSRMVIEQYRDDKRLQSRYLVHQQFSTAESDYLDWIFDHLLKFQPTTLFDLGCGPGYLWQHNAGRMPANWSLTLGDRSSGMLAMAANELDALVPQVRYVRLEAGRLPFLRKSFEIVLGLHVFHHLSHTTLVLKEIKRVLEEGGRLLAATNGDRHMRQFKAALQRCGVNAAYFDYASSFSLQNGEELLAQLFDRVECIHFKDALRVTEVEPLLDYARTGIPPERLDEQLEALTRLERYWRRELERVGVIRIEKQAGLFIAS